MGIWNCFKGKSYHVLGNQDMYGRARKQVIVYWNAMKNHYSIDVKGFHCIFLDGNDPSSYRPRGILDSL